MIAALLACSGCGSEDMSVSQESLPSGECHYRFESSAARMSRAGRALLLYDCEGDACTGAERFAEHTSHAISLEVEADPATVLQLMSSDEQVASIADVASSYDPCAQRTRVWATLEAIREGSLDLIVTSGDGEIDRVALEVAAPKRVTLHASTLADFAFADDGGRVTVPMGESLLVVPELRDASGMLLVGRPALHWSVDDADIATVRTTPGNDDESFAKKQASQSTVFIDTRAAGTTAVRARTDSGVEGVLPLQVISADQAAAPAYAH